MRAVPLIENGHDANPGTVAVPVTVYGTSLPVTWPDAVPVAEMPLAQVALKVPLSDVPLWLVICHENAEHDEAARPTSGFDAHVPSSDGVAEPADPVGARSVPDCSIPAHAPENRARERTPARMIRVIVAACGRMSASRTRHRERVITNPGGRPAVL